MAAVGLQKDVETRAETLLRCAVSCDGPVEDSDIKGSRTTVFLQDTRKSDNVLRRMREGPDH